MTEDNSSAANRGVPQKNARWVPFVYWGAIAGILSGVVTLFTVSWYYGSTVTESRTECAAFAGAFTVLLSQPAAFFGLLAGAASGAVVGAIGTLMRHLRPAS